MVNIPRTAFSQVMKARDIVLGGDSLTEMGSSNWPQFVAKHFKGSAVLNTANGGNDSATILGQVQAAIKANSTIAQRMLILWTGQHDYTLGAAGCLANIAAMVAGCMPGWFRIIEPLPYANASYVTGQPLRLVRDAVAAGVAKNWPAASVPILSYLQAAAVTPQDIQDVAQGWVPTSLRQPADDIHMTLMVTPGDGTGNDIIYQRVIASLPGF